jgi:hypothetical protein
LDGLTAIDIAGLRLPFPPEPGITRVGRFLERLAGSLGCGIFGRPGAARPPPRR